MNSSPTTIVVNSIYLPNKYTKWYYSIVNNALNRTSNTGITETHHIVMESLYVHRTRKGAPGWLIGNPSDPNNLVELTPREHYVCHMLLVRMLEGKAKVKAVYAARYMCITKKDKFKVNSRLYATLKELYNAIDKTGNPAWNKGKKMSIDQRKKLSEAAQLRFQDPEQRRRQAHMKGKSHSHHTRALMSQRQQGKMLTEEHKRKIGETNRIRAKDRPPISEHTREKLAIACKGRLWTPEILAKAKANMKGQKVGYKWWTNGIASKCSAECPGDGWYPGRCKST